MASKTVKMKALLTLPRWECTAARTQITHALQTLRIPCAIAQGVWYGQCMTRLMEQALSEGVEWILTIDGDSFFTSTQLQHLMTVFAEREDLDALAALQCRRGVGLPLLTVTPGVDGTVEAGTEPLMVATAHFGLTLFRADKIRALPRPWFIAIPDNQGGWGEGKIDEDIHFWLTWQHEGNRTAILPTCRIGHLEEMIVVFDETMTARHLYPHEFHTRNPQPGAHHG